MWRGKIAAFLVELISFRSFWLVCFFPRWLFGAARWRLESFLRVELTARRSTPVGVGRGGGEGSAGRRELH